MKYSTLDLGTIEAVFNKLGGLDRAAQFLRGELMLVEQPKPELPPEPVATTPAIVEAIVSGKTDLWLHPDQVGGVVKGQVIYDHLKTSGLLVGCVGLDDLKVIQAQGIVFFRRHFAGKAIFGWKGVRDRDGDLCVPFLYEYGG